MKLLILALLLLPVISEAKKRSPASEENSCIANIGNIGSSTGVKKTIENVIYLKECLKYSESSEVIEIATTTTAIRGHAPRHFVAKIPASEIPFFFTIENFQYHIHQGKIVGVTQLR